MGSNEVNGVVHGHVVQANHLHGGVHVHHSESSAARRRLLDALCASTVDVGHGRGVVVAPGVALTCAAVADAAVTTAQVGDGLVLVRVDHADRKPACVSVGAPGLGDRLFAETAAGAPVVDTRTGGVCGVLDGNGRLLPIPAIPDALAPPDPEWLDLLTPDQLRAGGWRHLDRRLRDYLTAVGRADHEHSYSLVNLQAPPLSEIYLSREVTRHDSADGDQEPAAVERLRADRLLDEHPGVQVLGYPGVGKSSLVRRLAALAAREWLADCTGRFVPVLVPAEALARRTSLPEALADGVAGTLSQHLDRAQLVEMFRAEPLPGVAWLVLVDGLDEVLDRAGRRIVLDNVRALREHPAHRVVLTSRPLDRSGFLSRIDQAHYPTYGVEPFDDDDLREFAERVLRGAHHTAPGEAADDFLARVRRTNLAALAGIPLISTMLCLLYAESPDDELPENQCQLYDRYVRWLMTKLGEVDARAGLRNRMARHGPQAERAVDVLVENVEPLLREIAHGRLLGEQRPLLDHALSCSGVRCPDSVPPEEWTDALADVLRLTGLVIQPGQDFRFLHHTVEEYLAACHLAAGHEPRTRAGRRLLAPQRRWPWPLLEVKVFLTARWLEEGHDLTRPLRRLLRGRRWRHNIGFLAELTRHGVTLDPGLRTRAVRLLSRVVADPGSSSAEWLDCVTWLAALDADRAVRDLEQLAAAGSVSEHRRFEAVRELVSHDAERALPSVRLLLADTRISQAPRMAVVRHLCDVDAARAVRLFTSIAREHDNHALRVEAATTLSRLLRAGNDVLVELAHDAGLEEDARLNAATSLLEEDEDRAWAALRELAWSASLPATFRGVVRVFRFHAPEEAEALLTTIAEDEAAAPRRRFDAAVQLVEECGGSVDLALDIASRRDLDRESRMRAARLEGDLQTRVDIVLDVVAHCPTADEYRLIALEQLVKLQPASAAGPLAELVRNGRQTDAHRFRALELAARFCSRPIVLGLCEVLAESSSVDWRWRVRAARTAADISPSQGGELLAAVAEDAYAPAEDRHEVALELLSVRLSAGIHALVALGRDRSVPDTIRLRALKKANSYKPREARDALVALAEDSSATGPIRTEAASEVREKTTRERLLAHLATRAGHDRSRFDAALALARDNREKGLAALHELGSDRRASRSVRAKANRAAERIR